MVTTQPQPQLQPCLQPVQNPNADSSCGLPCMGSRGEEKRSFGTCLLARAWPQHWMAGACVYSPADDYNRSIHLSLTYPSHISTVYLPPSLSSFLCNTSPAFRNKPHQKKIKRVPNLNSIPAQITFKRSEIDVCLCLTIVFQFH